MRSITASSLMLSSVTHPASQFFRFGFFKATTGNRRSTYTEYRKSQMGSSDRSVRCFVDGDVSTAQSGVCFFTGQVFINQIKPETGGYQYHQKPL